MSPELQNILLRYLADDSSVLCLVFTREGKITYSNVYAETLTGLKLEGLGIEEIFLYLGPVPDAAGYLEHPDEKVLINIKTASGMPGTFYFRFYPFQGSVLGLGEADTTEMAQLQNNLLLLNQELNNLSRELQKKNAELTRLNDLKNQFLGIAAHDLRNPLGSIMGFSEILAEDLGKTLNADQQDMLRIIHSSSEFMLHLLNQLLDIAQIESGRLVLEKQNTDLSALLSKNIELNKVLASRKNIAIDLVPGMHRPELYIDPVKIEQVLSNLISNAIKYSKPGTVIRVELSLSNGKAVVCVRDQGPGIPEEETSRLFSSYYTTSVKSTGGEKSTGLGLAISKNIVQGHGGEIWVESRVGEGSAFSFSLPLEP